MSYEFVDDPAKYVSVGQTVKAEIIAVDGGDRKITLSIKDVADRELDKEAMAYQAQQATQHAQGHGRPVGPSGRAGATLGDVLASKLEAVKSEAPKKAATTEAEETK
ncbi:MAG: hypothetical protein R3A78_14805 [Polyangiales bacterium]